MAYIRVKDKNSGKVGLMPEENFDPNKYENLEGGGGFVSNLAKPFTNTAQRIGGGAESLLRNYLTGQAEGALKAGDNERAAKFSAAGSVPTRLTMDEEYRKKLEPGLQMAKDTAGVLSWGVPVGGATKLGGATLKTGVLSGGAAAGALGGLGYSGAEDVGGIAKDVAVGAGTGMATAAVLNKFFKGKKVSPEGKTGALSGVEKAGYNTVRGVVRPKSTGGFRAIGKEDELVAYYLAKGGAGKSANEGRYLMNEVGNKLEQEIASKVDDVAFTPKSSTALKTWVRNRVAKDGEFYTEVDKTYGKYLDEAVERLFKSGKTYNLKELLSIKAEARRLLGKNALNKLNSATPSQLSAQEMARADVYESVGTLLYDLGPEELKPLMKEMAMAHSVADGLTQAGKEAANLFGMPIPGIASGMQKVQSAVGKGMLDTGKFFKQGVQKGAPALETMIGGKLPTTAAATAVGGGAPAQPAVSTTPAAAQETTEVPSPLENIGLSKDDITLISLLPEKQQAALLTKIIENKLLSGGLSAESKKAVTKLDNATAILNQVESALSTIGLAETSIGARVGGVARKAGAATGVAPSPNIRAFSSLRQGIKPILARTFGEVGNLTAQEQENAINLIPDITDSEEEKKAKLTQLRAIIAQMRANY